MSLNLISDYYQNLLGGSADLTGSNNTKANSMDIINKDNLMEIIYTMELENMEWQAL